MLHHHYVNFQDILTPLETVAQERNEDDHPKEGDDDTKEDEEEFDDNNSLSNTDFPPNPQYENLNFDRSPGIDAQSNV